ncbi:Uncharacterized protein APZ42_020024 [Daphnia magna]|uniref:CUB domain-containing protein n=1 Tax=Daphnia magna TaxID=35525 RepID=A0A164XXX6_9CRUS|nr:Uncharacterized protein APZ42_020024 [Daphnia magna]
MLKVWLVIYAVLAIQTCRAWDGNNEIMQSATTEQRLNEYFPNAFSLIPEPDRWNARYFQKNPPFLEQESPYEGRTSSSSWKSQRNQFNKYFLDGNPSQENNKLESRLALGGLGANLINTGIFNNRFTPANTWRPFNSLANRIPITYNPNFDSPLDDFDGCTSPSGESGICVPGSACSLFGGKPSGSCVLGKVCCINAITGCGGSVTLNNTYWQSPITAVSASSSCTLTVRLNTKYVEQLKKPICQIRLDFVSFTTAQPTLGTCTDTFQVGGSTSTVPTICGDNNGQHMYIDVPSSATTPSDVQLVFNFGTATATRSWNIKIAMLPCGASYLGKILLLTACNTSPQALVKTELLSGQRATEVCLSACTVTNGDAFSITTPTNNAAAAAAALVTGAVTAVTIATANVATAVAGGVAATITAANAALATAQANLATAQTNAATAAAAAGVLSGVGTSAVVNGVTTATCMYDFLLIGGGRDAAGIAADRYCGNALNPAAAGSATNVQVCTPIKSFKMNYRTDSTEAAVAAATNVLPAPADTLNVGFCLDYQEK